MWVARCLVPFGGHTVSQGCQVVINSVYTVCLQFPSSYSPLGVPTLTWPSLPVDTSLSGSGGSSYIMSSGVPLLQSSSFPSKTATVVVTEGIPPVSCRLVEKIRKWEYYINLMDLLKDPTTEQLVVVNGQLVAMRADQRSRSSRSTPNICQWLQAFSVFSTVLLSSDDTTKDEAAGLAAHSYIIIQMSKDLQGSQWYQYDWNFHEWAAAKGIRKWGELNFTIYGRCLATQHPCYPELPSAGPGKQKRKLDSTVCYRWNDGLSCNNATCRYAH